MIGFSSYLPSETLLQLVHERQREIRDEFERARLAPPWRHRLAAVLRAAVRARITANGARGAAVPD